MKKTFKLTDLECANCAAKMEHAITKLQGVNEVSVNFLTQKMSIDAEDGLFESIMDQTVKICKKIEPDCVINR
jgi:Cation transport ATPase